MTDDMVDLDSLRDTLTKAQSKAKKARAQAESAEKEVDEIETAIRVIERMSGIGDTPKITAIGENATLILRHIGDGEAEGLSPKEVYDLVSATDNDISADLVRTQLWRMAKRGILINKEGRYWRPKKGEASDAETSEASESTGLAGRGGSDSHPASESSSLSRSTPSQSVQVADWDDDVPF